MNRKPILLDKNAVAMIQIFEKNDEPFDVFNGAWDYDVVKTWDDAAAQFISQLDDHWCVRFLESLRQKIDDILEHQ